MKITVFSTLAFERPFMEQANAGRHDLQHLDTILTALTAPLAQGSTAVAVFTPDGVSAPLLEQFWAGGVRYVAMRGAGYDNVDLAAAYRLGMRVANVPDSIRPTQLPNTP